MDDEHEYLLPVPAATLGLRDGYSIHWIPGILFCSPHQVARDWEILGPHGPIPIHKNGTVQVSRADGRNLFVLARKLALAARYPEEVPEHLPDHLPVAQVGFLNHDPRDESLHNLRWMH